MAQNPRNAVVPGFTLGVAIAFLFAMVIRLVPAEWLVNPVTRAWLYAAQVPAGLLFIPIAGLAARARGDSPRQVLLWACCGALAFDGLVLGFWPGLYGHDGLATTIVATLLLWAFAWIVAAALLFAPEGEVPTRG